MNKKFFIVFIALLFIGACGKKDSEANDNPTTTQEPATTQEPPATAGESGSSTVPVSGNSELQECLSNLREVYWGCKKENQQTVFYRLSFTPPTAGSRSCSVLQRHQSSDSVTPNLVGGLTIFSERYNQKKDCVDQLNLYITKKRNDGYVCGKHDASTINFLGLPANPC